MTKPLNEKIKHKIKQVSNGVITLDELTMWLASIPINTNGLESHRVHKQHVGVGYHKSD